MLMPLIYMKAVFEANYSRKLSSLKHRLVVIPADAGLPSLRPNTYLYWQWAFEAPHNVKLLIRQELGEDNSPQVRYPAYTRHPNWLHQVLMVPPCRIWWPKLLLVFVMRQDEPCLIRGS